MVIEVARHDFDIPLALTWEEREHSYFGMGLAITDCGIDPHHIQAGCQGIGPRGGSMHDCHRQWPLRWPARSWIDDMSVANTAKIEVLVGGSAGT